MTPRRHDQRFYALLDLAKSGDPEAPHDLWLNYHHDFDRDGDPRDRAPTRPLSETQHQQHEEK
jgi:hypothetical protein